MSNAKYGQCDIHIILIPEYRDSKNKVNIILRNKIKWTY